MTTCIAPHIDNELAMVMQGDKPLAILYRDKQPIQFEGALLSYESIYVEFVRHNVIAIAQDLEKVEEYKDLVANRNKYTRKEYQYLMGKLFGYTEEECQSYIKSTVAKTCTCVECGGEL